MPSQPLLFNELQRSRLVPRKPRSIFDFAAEKLVIVDGPIVMGQDPVRWHPDLFPPQREMIKAADDRRWSSVTFLTGPQTAGKTLVIGAILAHAISERIMSAAYISGNVNLAGTQWGKKFKRIFEADKDLRQLIPDNSDFGGKREERKFMNRTSLHFAGADSDANLSGFTAPVVVCDDVQSYPKTVGDHGHPADYAQTRAEAFAREQRTIIKAGTAGVMTDHLTASLFRSAFYLPFLPCLKCGTYQLIEFERFVFDDSSPLAAGQDCWMRCANLDCEHQVRFHELPEMLRKMAWVSMPPLKDDKGKDVEWITAPASEDGTSIDLAKADVYPSTSRNTDACGFWLNKLYWPFGETWSQVARNWVEISGDPDGRKNFYQNTLSRPQKEIQLDEEKLTVEQIEGLKALTHKVGRIPLAAGPDPSQVAITIGIDVQWSYIYITVRAWNRLEGTSYLIFAKTVGRPREKISERASRAFIVEALEDVSRFDAEGWPLVDAEGKEVARLHADIFAVDASHKQDTIYAFVNARGGERGRWRAVRGSKLKSRDPKGEIWPVVPKFTRNGRGIWREPHVNRVKLIIRELMMIPVGQAGSWNLPSDMHRDTFRAYAAQMASEEYDSGRDKWIPRGANHFMDCDTYATAAAVGIGVCIPEVNPITTADRQESWAARKLRLRQERKSRN